jgi:hypothetical protein
LKAASFIFSSGLFWCVFSLAPFIYSVASFYFIFGKKGPMALGTRSWPTEKKMEGERKAKKKRKNAKGALHVVR